jgi:hypothetical protein
MADDERKRLVNTIFYLVDLLILSNFLMFRFSSDPNIWTLNLTIISWIIFITALLSVNIWAYYSYYKKPKMTK